MSTATRKCSHCGHRFRRDTGIVQGVQAWCSDDHRIEWAIGAGKKLRNIEFKERKARFKANDKSAQMKLTQQAFNRMIRELDKTKGCISCDRPASWQGQWHASHLKSVGSHPMLRFDARNCHKACSVCNNYLSGNLPAYRTNLAIEYGPEILAFLDGKHDAKHYQCAELIEMRAVFMAEVRRLEQGKGASREWRGMPIFFEAKPRPACCVQ